MNEVLKEIEHTDGTGIVVRSDEGVQMLLLANIIYVEAMEKKDRIPSVSGRNCHMQGKVCGSLQQTEQRRHVSADTQILCDQSQLCRSYQRK